MEILSSMFGVFNVPYRLEHWYLAGQSSRYRVVGRKKKRHGLKLLPPILLLVIFEEDPFSISEHLA